MVLDASEWKSMFGLMQDLQITIEQLQVVARHPETWEVIPEGTASLVE